MQILLAQAIKPPFQPRYTQELLYLEFYFPSANES